MTDIFKITELISRMDRANIPKDGLIYELTEFEWAGFTKRLAEYSMYQFVNFKQVNEVLYLGLRIRKHD